MSRLISNEVSTTVRRLGTLASYLDNDAAVTRFLQMTYDVFLLDNLL